MFSTSKKLSWHNMNDGGIVCNTPNVLEKNRNFYGFSKFDFIIHMSIIFAKVFYYFAFFRINHYRFDCF